MRAVLRVAAILALCSSMACTEAPATTTYDVGVRPRALAVADLDGDDRWDVAVANAGSGSLSLFLGDGKGGLRLLSTVNAGSEPGDVAAIDVDDDDDVDLVVANHETSHVTILLNDGRAGFAPAPASPLDMGARPHLHGVAVGDFDGDGRVDIVAESSGTDAIVVAAGAPDGFAPASSVPVGTMPYYRLGAADVNGDERPEILVPGAGDRTVRIVHADGGTYRLLDPPIPCATAPSMVRAGDCDGDGRIDLVAVVGGGVHVWLASDRGFRSVPGAPFRVVGATEVATGDLDGDGRAEVVVGAWDDPVLTLIAGGSFETSRLRACARPVGLACADLDGDGRDELLVACANEDRLLVMRPH